MKQIKTFDTFINEAMNPSFSTLPAAVKEKAFGGNKEALAIYDKLYAALKPFGFTDFPYSAPVGDSFTTFIDKGASDYDGIGIRYHRPDEKFTVFFASKGIPKFGEEGKSFPVSATTADQILKLVEPYKKMTFKEVPEEKGYEG